MFSSRIRRAAAFLAAPLTRAYWLRGGFACSYAAARIALAFIYLYIAYGRRHIDVGAFLSTRNPSAYRPLGLWMLWGDTPPPVEVFQACHLLLLICPILLLIGFASRMSMVGSIVGLYAAAVMDYGWEIEWSHGYSPVLVSSLPMLFGPAHLFGIDGWIRRWRGHVWSLSDDRRASMAVLGVQFSIAMVFFNAAFWKFYAVGEYASGFVPWAFSDNLRNVLLRQHVALDEPMSPLFRFIVSHRFAYVGMALCNLIAQMTPFFAVWLVSRPWLRLMCGMMLALEVVGLGIVMGIANWQWLVFLAVFVDWDRLVFRPRARGDAEQRLPFTLRERGPLIAVLIVLGFQIYVSFMHDISQRWTFPFTSYPMFSLVASDKPYDAHLPFYLPAARYEIESDHPHPERLLARIWRPYWGMTWIEDFEPFGNQIVKVASSAVPARSLREVRAYAIMLRFPSYPETEPKQTLKLLKYRWQEGRSQTVGCALKFDEGRKQPYLELHPAGFRDPDLAFRWFDREGNGPYPVHGERVGRRLYFRHPGEPFVVAAEVKDGDEPAHMFAGILVR
ncbi:MAG: hypothetical protein U0744_17695 [Gemmataceae bacterium]